MRHFTDESGRPIPFETLMQLEKVKDCVFVSTTEAYQPGSPVIAQAGHPQSYGGHVYAQAVWAAAQTVGDGFLVNVSPRKLFNSIIELTWRAQSVSGFFISMSLGKEPLIYTVRKLRNGRSYCSRAVDVTQEAIEGVIFTCICSFKKPDANSIELQEQVDINSKYAQALGGKRPQDHPVTLVIESTWFKENEEAMRAAYPFPGVYTRTVDMQAYNEPRPPLERRRLIFYSPVGAMPPVELNPNLHACAHLYASDRNSLYAVTEAMGLRGDKAQMASLTHTVVFHTSAQALSLSSPGDQKWCLQEAWTDRQGDGRGVHHSRLWSSDGVHLATTMQDGMVRLKFESDEELERARERVERGRAKI